MVLLAIPLTVYLVQQQQENRSQAVKNTTLSFSPPTATVQSGDNISFDIVLSPGSNQVSLVKLVIKFDSTKLSATTDSFEIDPASQLSILQQPVVGTDTLSVILSVGSDPTKVIQTETKIGSVSFDVVQGSSGSTEVSFDPGTEISSIGGADAYSENVFLSGAPATITIQGGTSASPTPTATPSPTLTQSSGNSAPVCSDFNLSVSATGVAPYTITFNASGTDSDGTIAKATFNFEPSFTEDVSTSAASVDVSATHTYNTPGIYPASVVLTDDDGSKSNSTNCSATVTITDSSGNTGTTSTSNNSNSTSNSSSSTTTTTSTDVTPSPLPATGPEETIVGFGVLGGILFLIGTLLFLAL